MALDERYITSIDLEEYFVNNETGEPLSGGTIEFWVDTSRATPKPVYQLTGSPPNYTYTELPNPITLSSVGTVVNNSGTNVAIYYFPFDADGNLELYFIVVRDSDGTVQEIREAWPNVTPAADPTKTENSVSNMIGNSQFVDVLFEPQYGTTISFAGALSEEVFAIAPDWDLVISSNGAGSVVVNRTPIAGSSNVDTNPPFMIDIEPEGGNISSLVLRQRLYHNPDIWASEFLAGRVLISSQDGINHTISLLYAPNIAPASTVIATGTTGTAGFETISGTVQLDPGTNTDTGDDGYVDIEIVLPIAGHVSLTSVQIVGLTTDEQDVEYQQEPANRQEDHLFHYYNPLLQYKPARSFLYGWNFPLNPTQFGVSGSLGSIGANKSSYVWDQTIAYQSANNSVSYGRQAAEAHGYLYLEATAPTQTAIVQYLDLQDAYSVLHAAAKGGLSSYIKLYASVPDITATISLWYTTDATLPNVASGTNNSIVLTLTADGKPDSRNGNWTEIPRSSLGDAKFEITGLTAEDANEFQFSGWSLPEGHPAGATYFAIVVGFSEIQTSEIISIEQVTVCSGAIASPDYGQTEATCLNGCERFYEKSYPVGSFGGAITTSGQLVSLQMIRQGGIGTAFDAFETDFCIPFRTRSRKAPVVTTYSPVTGASGEVHYFYNSTANGDKPITDWTEIVSDVSVFYQDNNNTAFSELSGLERFNAKITYHYIKDARLGIVL